VNATKIEWTDRTWNPVTGCTKVSPGCDHCYAEGIARRFAGSPAFPNGFDVTLHEERITAPLRWRKPARVFVNSMSDLFHQDIPDEFIARVFAVMAATQQQHTYQVLTKRHGRMRSLLSAPAFFEAVADAVRVRGEVYSRELVGWPLPNVWLGVSVEDQKRADLRIPALLETTAAVRFLSCEPLLGPVDLSRWLGVEWMESFDGWGQELFASMAGRVGTAGGLHWVIVGGESGPGARPMHPGWARHLRDQCAAADVPFFMKQRGEWTWARPTDWPVKDWARNPDRNAVVFPDGRVENVATTTWGDEVEDAALVYRVGKKAAGRELDGRTWDQYPAVPA
jgi:protein gp37